MCVYSDVHNSVQHCYMHDPKNFIVGGLQVEGNNNDMFN
jgi:hypothetical protein